MSLSERAAGLLALTVAAAGDAPRSVGQERIDVQAKRPWTEDVAAFATRVDTRGAASRALRWAR